MICGGLMRPEIAEKAKKMHVKRNKAEAIAEVPHLSRIKLSILI